MTTENKKNEGCCGGGGCGDGGNEPSDASVRTFVSEYYGKVLKMSEDLKTNACCASGAPPAWMAEALSNVHDDVASRFYGCGFPIPEVLEGATVLDLGCGTGRDVYVLSQLVGPDGFVHGVDMTPDQLVVGQDTLDWHMEKFGYEKANVAFHEGFIEDLSMIESDSVDVVVSNCVVNLSPRKDTVMAEIYRVLKPGGEFYFSDVFVDRRLPDEVAFDPILHAECLGGAMYIADFMALAKQTGFLDPRTVEASPITIQNGEIETKVGSASFESVTLRLFKLEGLDPQCENYGQIATYTGGIAAGPTVFWLDDHHAFEAHRPERICNNTADMLQHTRYAKFFDVTTGPGIHFGAFACDPTLAAAQYGASCCTDSDCNDGSCNTGGGCC